MKNNSVTQPIIYQPSKTIAGTPPATATTVALIGEPVPSAPPPNDSLIRSDISVGPLLTGITLLILMRRHR